MIDAPYSPEHRNLEKVAGGRHPILALRVKMGRADVPSPWAVTA
jgi:hypothetical protein